MSYKINYCIGPPKKHTFFGFQVLVSAFVLLLAIVVRTSWPAGTAMLQQILVSNELSREAEAFSILIDQIGQGESVPDVVAVFCQEIFGEN